jgi:serine/threonine protein kinase
MAAREGEIMRVLGTEFYRDHGWDEERSWLTLRWIDGTSLWDALEPAYRGEGSATMKQRMLALAAGAARELANLHAAGWAHGDLQPDHVISEGAATHLIDLACAQGPADVPFYAHRGGLAHTTAPEVADLILTSEEHIALTSAADVWSLGASLWWAWTRTPPIVYSDPAAGRTAQLKDIAAGRRPDRTVRRWPFDEFEDLLMACLAADPGDRSTAEQLATAVSP